MHIITQWLGPCTNFFDDSQQSQFSHSYPAKLYLIFTYHTGGTIQQKCVAKCVLFYKIIGVCVQCSHKERSMLWRAFLCKPVRLAFYFTDAKCYATNSLVGCVGSVGECLVDRLDWCIVCRQSFHSCLIC